MEVVQDSEVQAVEEDNSPYLSEIELLKMLLAQERVIRARLEAENFDLRWKEQVNAYTIASRQKTLQSERAKADIKKTQLEIEERLGLQLSEYAFDDVTGRLTKIEE